MSFLIYLFCQAHLELGPRIPGTESLCGGLHVHIVDSDRLIHEDEDEELLDPVVDLLNLPANPPALRN